MDKKKSFTIGEASRICDIPASTLRYYDQINLVKPPIVGASNNYRYYTYREIAELRIIQDFRELGFSIPAIQDVLKKGDRTLQLELMNGKRKEIMEEISALKEKSNIIANRIQKLKNRDLLNNISEEKDAAIEIKYIPRRRVTSLRKQSLQTSLDLYIQYFNELINLGYKAGVKHFSGFALVHHHVNLTIPYNQEEYGKAEKDVEVCGIISKEQHVGELEINYFKEGLYFSMITRGMAGKEGFEKLYHYIQAWLKKGGYAAAGPLIDILHADMTDLHPDKINENIITEVQILIKEC